MNISSSFSSPLSSGINKPVTPIKNSVASAEPAYEIAQEQSSNNQTNSNVAIDEQAIALFEQNQVSLSLQEQASKNNFSSTSQNQLFAKNETAVANYQVVSNLAQRESIQQLFGVDLFA